MAGVIRIGDPPRVLHVAERTWPVMRWRSSDNHEVPMPGFRFRVRIAHTLFESGWGMSVIWGSGTYSDNHDAWADPDVFTEEPEQVEVGVMYRDELVGDPYAYVDARALNRSLDHLARLPSAPPGELGLDVKLMLDWG
jgi:hypothetical protein